MTRAAELDHVTAGVPDQEIIRRCAVRKLPDMALRKTEFGQQRLCVGAVVLEPVAIGAAADHAKAFVPQLILKRAESFRHRFEDDDPVPDPVELGPPIFDPLDQPEQRPARQRLSIAMRTSWPSSASRR